MKYQRNIDSSVEINEYLNEISYYWSIKDHESDDAVRVLDSEQSLAICLLNGNFEL